MWQCKMLKKNTPKLKGMELEKEAKCLKECAESISSAGATPNEDLDGLMEQPQTSQMTFDPCWCCWRHGFIWKLFGEHLWSFLILILFWVFS